MAMTPPTTSPAIAPVFDPLPEEEALEVGLTLEKVDVPISDPGRISEMPEERRSVRRES